MNKTKAEEAIYELTLLLMYLTKFEDGPRFKDEALYHAWKGYDFNIINKLWDDELINQGKHPPKSKSVYITQDGLEKAKELLVKYGVTDWEEQ